MAYGHISFSKNIQNCETILIEMVCELFKSVKNFINNIELCSIMPLSNFIFCDVRDDSQNVMWDSFALATRD